MHRLYDAMGLRTKAAEPRRAWAEVSTQQVPGKFSIERKSLVSSGKTAWPSQGGRTGGLSALTGSWLSKSVLGRSDQGPTNSAVTPLDLDKVASVVPSPGLRRLDVPPATPARQAAAGSIEYHWTPVHTPKGTSTSSTSLPNAVAIEGEQPEDERHHDQRNIEAACRQLWSGSHALELQVKRQLKIMQKDPKSNLSKTCLPWMVSQALQRGARLDWRSAEWDGATLLLKSVRTGSMDLVAYLLHMGADPAVTDNSGRGLLHWAAVEGNCKMMEHFLANLHLDTNKADSGGDTPLHLASFHGHLPVVRLLVMAGTKTDTPNNGGFFPHDLAEAGRRWHVASYLRDPRAQDKDAEVKVPHPLRELTRPCDKERATELRDKLVALARTKGRKKKKKGSSKSSTKSSARSGKRKKK